MMKSTTEMRISWVAVGVLLSFIFAVVGGVVRLEAAISERPTSEEVEHIVDLMTSAKLNHIDKQLEALNRKMDALQKR